MKINGYPDYLISKNGRVYSIRRKSFLVPAISNKRKHVGLTRYGKRKDFYIYQLLAEHFLKEYPNQEGRIYFIDGNRENTTLNNLVFLPSEYPKSVIQTKTGKVFQSITEASKATGIRKDRILKACKSKNRLAGGYRWKFYNQETN